MSQFDQHLKTARNKQRRLYLGALFGVIVALIVIVSIILVTRATRIEILPEEAPAIARLSVSEGLAFIAGKTLYALSGNPAVTVEAAGFYTRQQPLTDADFGKVMTITLTPLPARIVLKSPVTDNRTKWLVDNQLYLVGNELDKELEPGDYSISVMHPYYEIKVLSLSLGRGDMFEETLALEPIAGELLLKSRPAGANIRLDETEHGVTPATLPLQGGQYQVQVNLDGFEPITETIEISRDANRQERDYQLEPEKGQLNVSLSPAGGKLVLNNLQMKLQNDFRLPVNKQHTLSYAKPGYFSQQKSFRVNTNSTTRINIVLEKETGQLELTSTPAAEVRINGEAAGTTPLNLTLDALPQSIIFEKSGFRSVTKQVLPSSKSVKKIDVSLVPERTARLQEAPSSYRHKAGGTMKLYRPNDTFKMGAERSEPGQRANEFVKTVHLNRTFYAGVNEVNYATYNQYDQTRSGSATDPVTGISWADAAGFCNWLSRQEGLREVYRLQGSRVTAVDANADGYRLLTEAEWEWLARKANRKQRTRFVWGDDMVIPKNAVNIADESAQGSVRNFVPKYNDGFAGVAPVGSFDQEIAGLFDQGGNVSEWVHDSYSLSPPKSDQILSNPFDTGRGDSRVVKGGNWRSGTLTELRASYREGLSAARDDVGFRVGRYVYGGQ